MGITATYTAFLDGMERHLGLAVGVYANSAPVVSRWADDLYIRMGEDRASVTLEELFHAQRLMQDGNWMDGSMAANFITKLLYSQGKDTTGLLYE